jgi:hypothetical protein
MASRIGCTHRRIAPAGAEAGAIRERKLSMQRLRTASAQIDGATLP